MRKHCSVCGGPFGINRRGYKTTHSDMDVFCSPSCTLRRIRDGNNAQMATCHKPSYMNIIGRRSLYEGIVEDYFGIYGIRAAYEPFAIRLHDGRRYIPDFYLPDYNMLVEVKGVWASKGKQKLSKVLDVIPDGSLVLIPSYIVKQMEKVCRKVR